MTKDNCCHGCRDGKPHRLHYSANGTPVAGGIMVAGRPISFGSGKPPVLIECAGNRGRCTWSAWHNDRELSDAAFTKRATADGWTIRPTRCPQHA